MVQLHSAVQGVLKQLSLPTLPPLRSTTEDADDHSPHEEVNEYSGDAGPSCDNSPKLLPRNETMGVPIESLYQMTGLKSLRREEPDTKPGNGEAPDFISNGTIRLEDAERLANLYLSRLDHYIYNLGSKYSGLTALRRQSPILTACILTVAALHDPDSNHLYQICNKEFRRLLSASMFDRRISKEQVSLLHRST